jgi:hypothetical protein
MFDSWCSPYLNTSGGTGFTQAAGTSRRTLIMQVKTLTTRPWIPRAALRTELVLAQQLDGIASHAQRQEV